MKIGVKLQNLIVRALVESMTVDTMELVIKRLQADYSLSRRLRPGTAFPPIGAAKQIVADSLVMNIFPQFVNQLIEMQNSGYQGRLYQITYLEEIVSGVTELGFVYDDINKIFIEDDKVSRTRNWGALIEDSTYTFAILRLDIAGNSVLVREYPKRVIEATYADLRNIVERSAYKRNGRVWSWEGDGGLCAFFYAGKSLLATLSAMEIAHELYLYNIMRCRLKNPLEVRIAVHWGPCRYTAHEEDLKKFETIKQTIKLESEYAKPHQVTISSIIYGSLDGRVAQVFKKSSSKSPCYAYAVRGEQK